MKNYMCFFNGILAIPVNIAGFAKRPISGISDEMTTKDFGICGRCSLGCKRRGQGLSDMFF